MAHGMGMGHGMAHGSGRSADGCDDGFDGRGPLGGPRRWMGPEGPRGRGRGWWDRGEPGPHGWGGPRGRGPGGRARRGDIRLVVLGLLAQAPSNGYGLITAIEERTRGAWRPSPGSVYPTLQQLVDEGLVTETDDGGRALYALTDAGRAYTEERTDELARLWEDVTGEVDEEFHESVGRLLAVVRQLPGAQPRQRAAAIEKMDELRRELYRILAD